jgi:hypothetical protein
MFQKPLTETCVRVTITPEQTFGVDKMVQSWAMGSHPVSRSTYRIGAVPAAGSSARMKVSKGMRLARLAFFALAFLVLFSGLTLMRTFASDNQVQPVTAVETKISADAGDSLWSLAASVKKDTMDNRQAVHLIMKRNGLHTSALQNGQVLIVPAEVLP